MAAVYKVTTPSGERLVRARSKDAAINHAIRSTVTAECLTASECVDLMATGLKVADAAKVKEAA